MEGFLVRCAAASLLALALATQARASEQVAASTRFIAIGDSITTGFNARHLLANPRWSWTTGNGVADGFVSEASRLEDALGHAIVRYNFAVAGSRVNDLYRQVRRAEGLQADFGTVMIGANDVCRWPEEHSDDLAQFTHDLRAVLSRLIDGSPQIRLVVVPVPDMGQLQELGAAHGCQATWNITGLCSPLLGGERTAAERQAFLRRLADLNQAIAGVAEEFSDNVRFDAGLSGVPFEWQHISPIDCFHPSVAGQGLIADKVWESGWWR